MRSLPGVQAAAPRYEDEGVDSFSLQEPIHLIAYPGDHTAYEYPPLTAGRRLHSADEAEVGSGLAGALGLAPGSSLVVELGSGSELRLRGRASSARSTMTGSSPTSRRERCSP